MRLSLVTALLLVPIVFAVIPTNPGDLNADDAVNILDVNLVTSCLGQSANTCQSGKADPNNDGQINIFDFVHVAQYWGATYNQPPPYVETCGNNVCNATAGETCSTCSADCGPCLPPSTSHPNEPAGFSPVWTHDMTGNVPGSSFATQPGQLGYWYSNQASALSFTNGKMRINYPVGYKVGNTPATMHVLGAASNPPQYDELYIHLKGYRPGLSAAEGGDGMFENNAVGTKIIFIKAGVPASSGAASHVLFFKPPVGNQGVYNNGTITTQFESAGNPPSRSEQTSGKASARIYTGQDNDIEIYMKINTVDVADGTVRIWVNGVLAYEQSDWLFRITGETTKFYGVWLDWTYGGNSAVTKTRADTIQLDEFYASAK